MVKNYIKIAFRSLVRNKAFSVINITGLAIGIASCLVLFRVITYELSYDTFQPRYHQIYHVVTQDQFSNGITYNPGIPFPALNALRLDFPQLITGSILASNGSQVTVIGKKDGDGSSEGKFIEETGFFFCDPQFFKVFDYKWLEGNPSVLGAPNQTVLTRKTAQKYFGNWEDALGRYLILDNKITVKVAGILQDPPDPTDFPFSIITSLETAKANPSTYSLAKDWHSTSSNFQVYQLLPPTISPENINHQLLAFSQKNYQQKASKKTNFLQPLSELHFDKRFSIFGDHITSKSTLMTLSLISLFIIIMACINFINLSTAQAVNRGKEVGIRKTLGGSRGQLFTQVMGETSILVVVAVVLACGIAIICLPFIKNIAQIQETLNFFSAEMILFLIALSLGIILFAGSYPAMILSGFRPVQALKHKITSATVGGISLRRGLVVLQFAISQILIIGTLVSICQMKFVKNADLGFNQDAILLFNSNADSAMHSKAEAFKTEIQQLPGVQSVSFSSDVPSSDNNWSTNFAYDHQPDETFQVSLKFTDPDYFKTYGLKFLAGEAFDKSDTMKQVVVNETFLRELGVKSPEAAIGKEVRLGRSSWKPIVGVVKDFKTASLRESVKPIVMGESKEFYGVTAIKLQSANIPKTKAAIETAWNRFYPSYAFTTSFMDENIARFYRQEDQLALLYNIFAGIALFISCLGLYGLVSFMALQKTKEIGVRKVLGASVRNIIYLFSKEFTLLILVGALVAVPVAWYMMSQWLDHFTYRIKMSSWIFIMAIFVSVLVAWIAVGYKSIRAAMANPVKSLRSE